MKKKIYSVVIGVIKKNNHYLLTKRKSPKREWNKWQFPGGELKFNESLEKGVKRELKEELGVEVKIIKFIPKVFEIRREKDYFHGLFFVFLCQLLNNSQKIVLNSEASEFAWFTKEEILNLDSLEGTREIINFIED